MGLFGREEELRWLRQAKAPVLTLSGPVGVGKTALAQHFASELGPGKVLRVYLDEARNRSEAARLIAETHELPPDTSWARLPDAVRNVHAGRGLQLLLLDDADHVLDAVARLVSSLGERVRVLVTSRTPLGLSSERVLRLAPLPQTAALELLRTLSPGGVSDAALTEIVDHLDALPWALQATSAWLDTLGPEETLRRLRAAEFPEHALRSAQGRAVQLEALLRASFELLPEAAREAFLRLSPRRGAFTAAEVEATLQDLGPAPLTLIETLRASSWLVDGPRPGLLRPLRPVRRIAHARWVSSEHRERWAHAQLTSLHTALVGATSALRAAELAREVDALLSSTAPSASNRALLARLAALRWGEDFLSDQKRWDATTAELLLEAGDEAELGEFERAVLLCLAGRSEDTAWAPSLPEARACLEFERGQQAFARGQLTRAKQTFGAARGLVPPNTRTYGLAAWGLARCLNLLGDDGASDAYATAIEALHTPLDRPLRVAASASYAYYLLDRRALDAAMASILALRLDAVELGAEIEEARTWIYEGNLHRERQDYALASAAYDRAEALCRRAGSAEWLGVTLMDRGILHLLHQEPRAAAHDLDAALAFLEPLAPTPCLPLTRAYRALLARRSASETSPTALDLERVSIEPDQPFRAALEVLRGEAPSPDTSDSQHLRLARRAAVLLTRGADSGLQVRRDGRSFRLAGAVHELGDGGPYTGLLRALAAARIQSPGRFVSAEALVSAGWPGEQIQASAAKNRLRVAMAKLRSLGLAELIESTVGGYRIAEAAELSWWDEP